MKCLIVSDIDNTLFPFSHYAIRHLEDDEFSGNPFVEYDCFDTPHREKALEFLQNKSAGNTRIQGMNLIEEIVKHFRYDLGIRSDVAFVTDRKYCPINKTEWWIQASCYNLLAPPAIQIMDTRERIDMIMRERESYYFILYIDDKPDALNMMANALISVKNKNVMTLVPEFPYNRTIGENLKRLGFKVHLMEHFFSCRYTKQSISATIKALRKFIERITYETGRG